MPTIKPREFRVLYATRQGFKHSMDVMAFDIRHAISSVLELETSCHRILSVLEKGMWE